MESKHSTDLCHSLGQLIIKGGTAECEHDILQMILQELPNLIPAAHISLSLVTPEGESVELLTAKAHLDALKPNRQFSLGEKTAIAQVIANQQAFIGAVKPNTDYKDIQSWADEGCADMMIAPLSICDQTIGTINVGRISPERFSRVDLTLLTQIATLLAVSIERLRLIHDTQPILERHQRYAERLEALTEMGQQLAVAITEEEVFEVVAEAIEHILEADRVSYVVPNLKENTCQIFALSGNNIIPKAHQFPMKGTGIAAVIESGVPISFPNLANSGYYEHTMLVEQGLKMGWSVPIFVSNQLVGIMNAATSSHWPFPDDALTLFSAIGRFMETTIERINARKDVTNTLAQLEYQVLHDRLTDLPNRHWFDQTLAHEIECLESAHKRLFMFCIDLGGLKRVNDSLGHSVGDQLLCAVAKRLRQNLNAKDAVARMGGDEFVVLLQEIDSPKQAMKIAQRLLSALQEPYNIAEHQIQISGSLGISCYPDHAQTGDELMKYADLAMYAAKVNGPNHYQLYTRQMSEQLNSRLALEQDLRQAIAHDKFSIRFQPQVEISTGQIIAIEALLRWFHPIHGHISPAVFIPIAEEAGLITDILVWVLDQSLGIIAKLRKQHPNLYVSVNMSAQDFLHPETLTQIVNTALETHHLPGHVLELELTEGVFLEHASLASETIHTWKQQGIRLAIDDFGTGFSSLSYLLNLPIDTLKIDRTFVESIHADRRNLGVVKAILALGENLELTCVAEGVETEEQLTCLKHLGCPKIQGFLFAKPMSTPELERFLTQQSDISLSNSSILEVAGHQT